MGWWIVTVKGRESTIGVSFSGEPGELFCMGLFHEFK